eukprot:EG_transcript_13583
MLDSLPRAQRGKRKTVELIDEWDSFRRSPGLAELHSAEVAQSRPVASERLQHCHFQTFLASNYRFRNPVGTEVKIGEVTDTVLSCLRLHGSASIWVQTLLRIKQFSRHQTRLLRLHQKLRLRREMVLNDWLNYWRDCEDKVRNKIRIAHSSDTFIPSEKADKSKRALANAMAITPDSIKIQVLWMLYWLLWTQTARDGVEYWTEWLDLLRAKIQAQMEEKVALNSNVAHRATMDVLVTVIVKAMQVPKFHYRVGHEITFKELSRLATPTSSAEYPGLPPDAPQYLPAFLDSPLCDDPDWIVWRCTQPSPIIPPCTWTPPVHQHRALRIASLVAATVTPSWTCLPSLNGLQRVTTSPILGHEALNPCLAPAARSKSPAVPVQRQRGRSIGNSPTSLPLVQSITSPALKSKLTSSNSHTMRSSPKSSLIFD